MTTYSHIARSTAPSGVDTEDSFVNVSINCVAVGIRDHREVANLEEKFVRGVVSKNRTSTQ